MSTASVVHRKGRARTGVIINEAINIPASVIDLTSFNDWAEAEPYPDSVHVSYLAGAIWVDLDMEQLFTHNRVKTRAIATLDGLADRIARGYLFSDGVRFTNARADLSTEPDALFVSYESVQAGRVLLVPGKVSGFVRVDGSPNMVLEIVSDTSVIKDTDTLRSLYWKAGVEEFWLMDVREEPEFDILRRGAKGFSAVRKQAGGWISSTVFSRAFRLTRRLDPLGHPDFTLAARAQLANR